MWGGHVGKVEVPARWKVKFYAQPMRIGELGQASGVPPKTIRFYEQEGLLPEPARTSAGYRSYTDSALPRLRFIRSAQACGLTLAEIKQIITVRDIDGAPCQHVTQLLESHAASLVQRIADLTALHKEVVRLKQRARLLDPADCTAEAVCHVLA